MIKTCVIPIAGRGTRFLPVTKVVSKELLPIVNIPAIMYQVMECKNSGIEKIIFIVNKYNEPLLKHLFSEDKELDEFIKNNEKAQKSLTELTEIINTMQFEYVLQGEKKGTGGALLNAENLIKDEYFAVMFGDDLVLGNPGLKEMIEDYNKYHCNILGTTEIEEEKLSRYGILDYDENKNVIGIIEKPQDISVLTSHEANIGRAILNYQIFNCIKQIESINNEYYLANAIGLLKQKIKGCLLSGKYYDIGSHDGFVKANIDYFNYKK